MTIRPNIRERYFDTDGRPTIDGQKLLQSLYDALVDAETKITALEAKLTSIASVSAPSGGVMIDPEARTAISDIISGAG